MADGLLLAALAGGIVYGLMVLVGRRQARHLAELRASEARFRSLTELSADWFWETYAAHRITWLSGGTPVATFFRNTPTYGKRLWELPRVEVEPRALQAHLERLENKLPFFDLEIARSDERGARQVHIVSGQSQLAADGRLLGYRGVGRDVTEQRSAERGLNEAKERLELALDGGDLAEWHLDLKKREIYAGDGWVRFLGHERSPRLTAVEEIFPLIHPHDQASFRQAFIAVLKGKAAELSTEFRIQDRLVRWRWLQARGRVTVRDAGGRALHMSGTLSDIDDRKQAEAALREAEQRYRSLVELAPDGVLVHSERVVVYANPAAGRILRADSPQQLVGKRIEEFLLGSDLDRFRERIGKLEAGPGVVGFEERPLRRLDGSEAYAEIAAVSFLEGGRLVMQTVLRDITAQREARQAIAARERRFLDLVEASGEYVWETDSEGRYSYLSERVEAVLGYARAELLGRKPKEFMPLGEERTVDDWLEKHGGEGCAFRDLVHRSITKSGAVVWQSVSAVPIQDAAGRWCGHRGTAADVTARKQAEARIEFLTTRDALTGLPNRTLLAERAAQAILSAAHSRSRIALLCVDLDRFKLVNEALGHQAGDALLRAVAERLQNTLRREDTLARIGGDDFGLLWNGLKSAEEAEQLAQRILAILGRPFSVEGRALNVGASVGVAIYPRDGRDFAELLKNADAALYHAKDAGRGTFRFFAPELHERAVTRLQVENELHSALARSELVLHWHPVLRGRSEIVGAEALVRWQHPRRGLLMPEDFVPLAEECGLIRVVGEWTLDRALSQAGGWQRTLPGHAWVAINVSAPELAQGDAYVEKIKTSLRENAVDGSRIELEVTERTLMSNFAKNVETLRKIGELGVRFAIDDFGTGYSSLAYLRRLPIDKLKIDRMFLRSLESNATDQAIVRTIASLAKTLGVAVAAEGVESEAQLERVLALGCEQWQGHYFSAALDAPGFEALLSSASQQPRAAQK